MTQQKNQREAYHLEEDFRRELLENDRKTIARVQVNSSLTSYFLDGG